MAEEKGTELPLRWGGWVLRHKFGTAFVAVECLLVTVAAVFAGVFFAEDVAISFVLFISFVSILIALGIPRQKWLLRVFGWASTGLVLLILPVLVVALYANVS